MSAQLEYEVMESEMVEFTPEEIEDMPVPLYWRILIQTRTPKQKSKGGIALPNEVRDAEGTLDYVGKVVALGGLANTHNRLQGEPNQPKIGDYVAYGRYAGQQIFYRGRKLLLINDDEVLAIVPDPATLKIYA